MKRKFKILILTISVIAMLFAFAVTSSAEIPDLGRTDDLYESVLGENVYGYFVFNLVDDYNRPLFYFTMSDNSIYDTYGHYSLTIDEFNTLLTTGYGSEDTPAGFWNGALVNYQAVLFYFEDGNTYESLGAIQRYGLFDGPYAVYTSLQNNKYTQSDLDNAVVEYKNSTEYKLDVLEEVKKITGGESEGLEVFYGDYTQVLGAPSVNECFIPFGDNKSLYLGAVRGAGERVAFIVDSSMLREFCSLNNISTRSEFVSYVINTYLRATPEGEYGYPGLTDEQRYEIESGVENSALNSIEFDDLFLVALNYSEITSDTIDTKYNEGKLEGIQEFKSSEEYAAELNAEKLAGAEEFKSSEEYINALNNKYSTGYTEGVEAFKASDAYADALDLQFTNGKTAGVTEYKASSEYSNVLKAEYNEGYDNGVTDTQGENTKNETTKLISILIGVAGFGILFMAVLSAVGVFKKKRAKRR